MANIFHVSGSQRGSAFYSNQVAAPCAKLDVITAAMLRARTGITAPSGIWDFPYGP
jgi:hypothetical protein